MKGGEIPMSEMFGTFAMSVGTAVGMKCWARWAHKAMWHTLLWHMHKSHHEPRQGPFELNDVAIINVVPAIALLSYGFFHKGPFPGLCFGTRLGITVFCMAYMFIHNGLVHKRFSMGPIANVPYLRKVAVAHQIHHADKFDGVPYGLFLGPKELEEMGGLEGLKKEINRRIIRPLSWCYALWRWSPLLWMPQKISYNLLPLALLIMEQLEMEQPMTPRIS